MEMTEEQIREAFDKAVAQFGESEVHAFECATWRGKNWAGGCDCFHATTCCRPQSA